MADQNRKAPKTQFDGQDHHPRTLGSGGNPIARQTTEHGRRLSKVMAALGHWKASTNVRFEGVVIRGYIHTDVNHRV